MDQIEINGVEYVKKESIPQLDEKYVIIRTYSAGVFFGIIKEYNEETRTIIMKSARRIWRWEGAASLSELAIEGTQKPEECKFPCETYNHLIS